MKRQAKERKVEYVTLEPKNRFRKFDEKAEAEEKELNAILFPNSEDFINSLDSDEPLVLDQEITQQRKPAWEDDDETNITVGKAIKSQKRKLPEGGVNDRNNKYKELLTHKYKALVGTPKWASLDKAKTDDPDSDDDILRTSGFIRKTTNATLPPNLLEYKRVKDLNAETCSEGYINGIQFHPTSSVGLVAGSTGVASLFVVNGKENTKLHSISFEKYPIFCSKFTADGNEAIFGSRFPYCHSYDLISGKCQRSPMPHGLTQCKNFALSPCGNLMAVAGKWGEVHLLSVRSKESLSILKQNAEVTALCFNETGTALYGHSATGEVTVWDVKRLRVIHRWTDDGCIHGTTLDVSSCGKYLAAGSEQGVVNLYDTNEVSKKKSPRPRKTILNLRTSISDLKFNATSELLALSSMDIENSVRILHINSGTVFSNFPNLSNKIGHIRSLNISPNSGYLALGNTKSVVSLYRLKYFKNY